MLKNIHRDFVFCLLFAALTVPYILLNGCAMSERRIQKLKDNLGLLMLISMFGFSIAATTGSVSFI